MSFNISFHVHAVVPVTHVLVNPIDTLPLVHVNISPPTNIPTSLSHCEVLKIVASFIQKTDLTSLTLFLQSSN